ncbi:MAG TPA: ABC transporter permease [Acidimicrobiales bacterium]|nr:ABC transporter permease [Acidimicrobiales bacterium]
MKAVEVATRKGGSFLDDAGQLFALFADTVVRIPRRPWQLRDIAEQTWFIASVTLLPAVLLTLSFGLVIGLQVYNITRQFGAESAQGAAMVLAIVREAGPLGTTFMMAAAGGTAITADLGSRNVRDEIAAMRVMAVDPIHKLVVPRVIGAAIATLLLTGIVIIGGLFGGYFYAVVIKGSNAGAYFQGFTTLARMPDLYLALAKGFVFGVVAAVIAAWKGLYAKGGPGGVGMAVNRGVVITLLSLVVVNMIMTFGYLSLVPDALR